VDHGDALALGAAGFFHQPVQIVRVAGQQHSRTLGQQRDL
jgi:hypothetical protein